MDRAECCWTCAHWSATLSTLATCVRRPAGVDPQLGICQIYPPAIVPTAGLWASVFPEVHANRTCGKWSPAFKPEPGDGEEEVGNVVPFGRAAA